MGAAKSCGIFAPEGKARPRCTGSQRRCQRKESKGHLPALERHHLPFFQRIDPALQIRQS
jgi:hypothetical protein